MKNWLLSGLICVPIYLIARHLSDTFLSGALSATLYIVLDRIFIEGERT